MSKKTRHLGGLSFLPLLAGWAIVCAVGCGGSSTPPTTPAVPAPTVTQATPKKDTPAPQPKALTAAQVEATQAVLDKLTKRYAELTSYRDAAKVWVRYNVDGVPAEEGGLNFSLAFAKPNRLALNCYQAELASNGKQIKGMIDGVTDQVWVSDAPEELTLEHVYQDPMMGNVLALGLAGSQPALSLLLAEKPLDGLLQGAQPPVLIEPAKIGEKTCDRVKIVSASSEAVMWIDQQNSMLLRLELFPQGEYKQRMDPQNQTTNLRVVADFIDAEFNPQLADKVFALETPPEAIAMRRLVPLERPAPPPEMLGQKMPEFSFTRLDGTPVTLESLKGKVVVLDFWATWCQPCLVSLPMLERVYQKYKTVEQVEFIAISIDQPTVEDKQIADTFARLQLNIPIARANDAAMLEKLGIHSIPQSFLIDAAGVVQDMELGVNQELETELAEKIDGVRAGKNLFLLAKADYDKAVEDYELNLREASVAGSPATQAGPAVAPSSEPKTLRLTPLWKAEGLEAPGNLYVLPAAAGPVSAAPKILAFDGWKTIVELNIEGQIQAKHNLTLDEGEVAAYLRTAVNAEGKSYFLASAQGQQRMHLFDDQWKLLWHHPEGSHAGLADVQLGDVNGDGKLDVVAGYYGQVGLHGLNMEGKRLWANRDLVDVASVGLITGKPGQVGNILCTSQRGSLALHNAAGETQGEWIIGASNAQPQGRFVRLVRVADLNSDGLPEFCGLAMTPSRTEMVVGIDRAGREIWTYRLPQGLYRTPIEPVSIARLPGQSSSCWAVAAADSSIHLLAADGTLLDQFSLGVTLSGFSLVSVGDRTLLLASTKTEDNQWQLEAWTVTPSDKSAATAQEQPPRPLKLPLLHLPLPPPTLDPPSSVPALAYPPLPSQRMALCVKLTSPCSSAV